MSLYGYQPSKNCSQSQSVPPPKSSNGPSNEPIDKAKTTHSFADVKFQIVAVHSVGGVAYFDLCVSGQGQPEKAVPPAKEPNWILVSHKIVGELEKHGCHAQVSPTGIGLPHWSDRTADFAGKPGEELSQYRIDLDKLPEDIDLVRPDDSDTYDEIWYRQDLVQSLRAENKRLRDKLYDQRSAILEAINNKCSVENELKNELKKDREEIQRLYRQVDILKCTADSMSVKKDRLEREVEELKAEIEHKNEFLKLANKTAFEGEQLRQNALSEVQVLRSTVQELKEQNQTQQHRIKDLEFVYTQSMSDLIGTKAELSMLRRIHGL